MVCFPTNIFLLLRIGTILYKVYKLLGIKYIHTSVYIYKQMGYSYNLIKP